METAESSPRPSRRRFDRDLALTRAMELFWRRGYEATSMAELLKAMGINAPSLYAAFGSKERLFAEAVDHYAAAYSEPLRRALAQPGPVRSVIRGVLLDVAHAFTSVEHPAGCLLESGAENCSEGAAEIEAMLRERRAGKEAAIRNRLARAVAEGELPAGTDPARLAKYVNAVIRGMHGQARDGATREELEGVAEQAMAAWPAA